MVVWARYISAIIRSMRAIWRDMSSTISSVIGAPIGVAVYPLLEVGLPDADGGPWGDLHVWHYAGLAHPADGSWGYTEDSGDLRDCQELDGCTHVHTVIHWHP